MPTDIAAQIRLKASSEPALQSRFVSGLLWIFGFHHEEALRHFRTLLEQDGTNLLGRWGLAYASAPFYNRPWSWFTEEQKIRVARLGYNCLHTEFAPETEADIIKSPVSTLNIDEHAHELTSALRLLFRSSEPVSDKTFTGYQREYADRMLELAKQSPEHPDIVCLASEALLNCTPWQLWDIDQKQVAQHSRVEQALDLLQPWLIDAGAAGIHPGILHLHIHALEMSPHPQQAAKSADRIRQLVSSSENPDVQNPSIVLPPHLPHMASHIDVLQGDYQAAIDINRIAADRDESIPAHPGEFYQISRLHNVHMLLYAAMMAGRKADAMDAQNRLAQLARSLYDSNSAPLLKISVEGFFANRLHAAVRFGCWQEIIDSRVSGFSEENALSQLPFSLAMQSYVRSVALANCNRLTEAADESGRFQQLVEAVPDDYLVNNNPASSIFAVAQQMLDGEYHYHAGNIEKGLNHLRNAVIACDELAYCEPWGWMHPPRHALGALLLEQGQLDEATGVYETDLGINKTLPCCKQNPNNLWALHGLHECYSKLQRANDQETIAVALHKASAYADITIAGSCYCRSTWLK